MIRASLSMSFSLLESFSPKLIFFDIDGTLLNSQGHYSSKLSLELARLKERGIKLAIASGRPAIGAQFLFDDLPCIDAGLFCTGAELYDPSTNTHLRIHALEEAVLPRLISDVKAENIYCEVYTPDYYVVESDSELTQIHSKHLRVKPRFHRIDTLLDQSVPMTKLLLGVEESIQGETLCDLEKRYPQLHFAFAHFLAYPGWLFASVVSQKASKYDGFDELLAYHGVSASEVMAFGDSHSDIVFLERAGVGVAMGNALPEIQSRADTTTLHCDSDGVALALSYIR